MVFTSLQFFLFFLGVALVFWRLPAKRQWIWLLLASYVFYAAWRPAYVVLLFVLTLTTYFSARAMEYWTHKKRQCFALALVANLGVLFVFKYLNFFQVTAVQFFPQLMKSVALPHLELVLPLGLSFFTFQSIGYLTDVYRGQITAEKNFGKFALFIAFFPHITSGPIARAKQLLPQFEREHHFVLSRVISGLQLFILGAFKKLVIADNLGKVVDALLSNLLEYKGLSLLILLFLFAWQILADFSGYTDMARGVARILGFELLPNFHVPYAATSVRDFWRRWHMSLSSWFKDYLYIPLGGNRGGIWRTCMNTAVVFLLCGLWHGASWHFVLWGAFHGVVLALERAALFVFKRKTFPVPAPLARLYAFSMVYISWIFFRVEKWSDMTYIFRYALSGAKNFIQPSYLLATVSQIFKTNWVELGITIYALLAIMVLEWITYRWGLRSFLAKLPRPLRFSLYVLLLSSIVLLRNSAAKEFIYVQF